MRDTSVPAHPSPARSGAAAAGEVDPLDERLGELVTEHCGLRVDERVRPRLRALAAARAAALGVASLEAYFEHISGPGPDRAELDQLTAGLTVGETSFFRSTVHFEVLRQQVLPALPGADAGGLVRVLCAGCATGEEAWSFAIVLADALGGSGRFEVHAFDLDGQAIATAQAALYGARAMRRVPDWLRERYFEEQGGRFRVGAALRERVRLAQGNLKDYPPAGESAYDVIVCRSTLLYFERREVVLALRRFAQLLAPGRFLLLGQTEALYAPFGGFEPVPEGEGVLFRAPGVAGRGRAPAVASPSALARAAAPLARPEARPALPATLPPTAPPRGGPELLARAVDLLGVDRLEEAGRLFDRALDADPGSPLALLGRAYVAMGRNQDGRARADCQLALAQDPFLPEGYFLAGMLREKQGDAAGAERQYLRALSLDGDFALAWLYLGNLYLRGGHERAARREFRRALATASRKRPARGAPRRLFPDEMLRDLCRRWHGVDPAVPPGGGPGERDPA